LISWYQNNIVFIKPPLATARADYCIGAVHLFVRLFVCLSVCRQYAKKAIFLSGGFSYISDTLV